MSKELLSGYTTGTHATALLGAVLLEYYKNQERLNIEVLLEKADNAFIDVQRENQTHYWTKKTDNDDLDVTKGCIIHVELFENKPTNLKKQVASSINIGKVNLLIYAGNGVGIVTKAGLKIEPNFPAINPVPLQMMENIAKEIVDLKKENSLHLVFSVDDGELIAKETANEKVGVIGGISILGTRGVVKPISADAYLDSIKTEVSVANACNSNNIVYTLGNTAHDYANVNYDKTIVVEIGNFIYEGARQLVDTSFKKMIFISSVAKMCKIAQECKNTHNRFGGIDFDEVKQWLRDELSVDLGSKEYITLKAVLQSLSVEQTKLFSNFLGYKAAKSFKRWLLELEVDIKHIEIITLNGNDISKKELKW